MTTVYFVRHAEPNYDNHDDLARELTAKGLADRMLLVKCLEGETIDAFFSSPYKRSFDTIQPLADQRGLPIRIVNDFRERKVDSCWIPDFNAFARRQWEDFDYKLSAGESLRETQTRNIRALQQVLTECKDQRIVIGTHGTALSTIIHYYMPSFGYESFEKYKKVMPWVAKFTFDGLRFVDIQMMDIG